MSQGKRCATKLCVYKNNPGRKYGQNAKKKNYTEGKCLAKHMYTEKLTDRKKMRRKNTLSKNHSEKKETENMHDERMRDAKRRHAKLRDEKKLRPKKSPKEIRPTKIYRVALEVSCRGDVKRRRKIA